MPSDKVHLLKLDEEGVAWIGTNRGLARFDGTTVQSFTHVDGDSTSIQSNFIHDIEPDLEHGKIWLSTSKGISVFEVNSQRFRNYLHDPKNPYSVPDHQSDEIYKDKFGNIWAGFRSMGFVRYRPETDDFLRFTCLQDQQIRSDSICDFSVGVIMDDPADEESLWISTSHGLWHVNRTTLEAQRFQIQLEDKTENTYANRPTCMWVGKTGKILLGTWWYGIFEFDTHTKDFSRLRPCYSNGARSFGTRDVITSFTQASEHELWINTTWGVQLYDLSTNCITFAKEHNRYEKKWYTVEHIDQQGRMWSASINDGIRIYNPLMQQFDVLEFEPPDSRFHSLTRRIWEDTLRKQLFVATQSARGLFIFDLQTQRWRLIPPPRDYQVVSGEIAFTAWDMAPLGNGELLLIGEEDWFIYRPGASRLSYFSLQPKIDFPRFRGILKDSKGEFWISGYNSGLLRLNLDQQAIISYEHLMDTMSGKPLGGDAMVEDIRGNIWLREHNGLLIYERESGKFIYHEYKPTNPKAFRGMGPMEADESGHVWIASYRDMLAYGHADSLDRGIIQIFGKKDGLIGDYVNLVKMYQGKLLVFTDQCVQIFDPQRKVFEKHVDLGYGLGQYLDNIALLSDEQLAIARFRSIALFHPDSLHTNAERPIPYISSFKVFDETWNLTHDKARIDSVFLSYRQNFFSFEFSAVGYNLPDETTYRYKLEGFDQGWQDGTERRFASYTNVPGGEYRFFVEAINSEGLSTTTPSITYLFISTVWYKTGWFWILMATIIYLIIYTIYKWRIGQVRKEERLKGEYERKLADVEMSALRAQMNPHFIFNSLNSIEYYIISNEPEKASDYLNRFSRLIRLILQNSKSTLIPLKDELEALRLYIEMEILRFNNLFDYELKMQKGIDPEYISVPPMLLQPYVENAIWHGLMQKPAGRGTLDLSIYQENDHLICLIEDNGIGREAARKIKSKSANRRKSFGMKITSDRLAIMNRLAGANASVEVTDLYDEAGNASGTRIELVIPV